MSYTSKQCEKMCSPVYIAETVYYLLINLLFETFHFATSSVESFLRNIYPAITFFLGMKLSGCYLVS